MKKSNYYIGYFLDNPLCASTKVSAIKSYMINNRKLTDRQYDILPAFGDISKEVNKDDIWLAQYKDIYVTERELRIIARDWKYFLGDMSETINNLEYMRENVDIEHKSINRVIDLCKELTDDESFLHSDTFYNFISRHHLVNMDMSTYAAYVKNYPGYYSDYIGD